MGALASLEQLADVRAAVQSMLDAGGELAYGTLDSPKVTSADGSIGVVDGGAFMSPVLLAGPTRRPRKSIRLRPSARCRR